MFIEVTEYDDLKCSINIHTITVFKPDEEDGKGTEIYDDTGEPWYVKESYEEVKAKIEAVTAKMMNPVHVINPPANPVYGPIPHIQNWPIGEPYLSQVVIADGVGRNQQ